ncbi:MAG: hypothetical protein K2M17_03590, partial [Bacilli bacterium]|nr:hypothetical protein [Bacilli bacterium]
MKRLKHKFLFIFILFLIVGGLSIGGFIYYQKKNEKKTGVSTMVETKLKDNIVLTVGSELPKLNAFVDVWGGLNAHAMVVYDEKLKVEKVYLDENNQEVAKADSVTEKDILISAGVYKITIHDIDGKSYQSKLIVEDKSAPELNLKELSIDEGMSYTLNDFVLSCVDDSKVDCNLSFETEEMENFEKAGNYVITIVAKDGSLNEVRQHTQLIINKKNGKKPSTSSSGGETDTKKDLKDYEEITTDTY